MTNKEKAEMTYKELQRRKKAKDDAARDYIINKLRWKKKSV